MGDYASRQRKPGKHLVGMGLVVVLHLLIIWAIHSALNRTFVKKTPAAVEAILLQEQRPDIPPPPPPPPPPPKVTPPPPTPALAPPAVVPPAEVPVAAPPAPQALAAVTNTPAPAAPAAPPAPAAAAAPPSPPAPVVRAEPVRTAAVVNSGNCEKPEYPSASRRLEEEGTVSPALPGGRGRQSDPVRGRKVLGLQTPGRSGSRRFVALPVQAGHRRWQTRTGLGQHEVHLAPGLIGRHP